MGFCPLEVKISVIIHLFIAHINLGRNKSLHGRSQLPTAPAARTLECALSWFFTRNFTLDPKNVHSYGLGRQKLSLWKVCFKECIYSFKFYLPRKKCHGWWDSSSTGNMVKELFLFIFMLLIQQEMTVIICIFLWGDVMTTFAAVVFFFFFYLWNLNVEFLLIFNQTHVDYKTKCAKWFFFCDVQVTECIDVAGGRKNLLNLHVLCPTFSQPEHSRCRPDLQDDQLCVADDGLVPICKAACTRLEQTPVCCCWQEV